MPRSCVSSRPLTARAPRTRADLDAQRLRAHAAYHLGRLAEAEQASLRVLTRRAKDEAMMRLLVRVLQREGRHRDAAAWMTRLDELGTDTWDDTSTATPAQGCGADGGSVGGSASEAAPRGLTNPPLLGPPAAPAVVVSVVAANSTSWKALQRRLAGVSTRWGIAGPGKMAAAMVADFGQVSNGSLVAVGSRSEGRAGVRRRTRHTKRHTGRMPRSSPTGGRRNLHRDATSAAHRRRTVGDRAGKAILVEKAFTATVCDTERIVDAAAARRPCDGGDVDALQPRHRAVRELVDAGAIGQARVRAT